MHTFAKSHALNEKNIKESSKLLSKHFLAKSHQGKFRTQNMYVSTEDGRIEYVAASPYEVEKEMAKLFHDIEALIQKEMGLEEVVFHAAMIHLVFVKIHSFSLHKGR